MTYTTETKVNEFFISYYWELCKKGLIGINDTNRRQLLIVSLIINGYTIGSYFRYKRNHLLMCRMIGIHLQVCKA